MSALIPAPAGALATLPESARTLAAASLTPNTRRAYSGALAHLDSFLAGRALEDGALAAYLATLHDAGRAPAVAGQAVAAAKLRAKLAGQPSPAGPATDRVLAGFRREARDRGRGQVAGIRWEQADAIGAVAANGGGSLAGLRDAAIVALMSDAMLRVSEVAALDCADLATETDGSGRLTIRYSKTDQKGEGAVQFIGSPTVRRMPGSRAAFRGIRSGSAPRNRSQRPGPPLSICKRRAGGSRRKCPAGTPGASSLPAGPSRGSATAHRSLAPPGGPEAGGLAPRFAFQGRSEMSARGQAWAVQGC